MMAAIPGRITQEQITATGNLLEKWHIDANIVAADGWDRGGYDTFRVTPEGKKIHIAGDLLLDRHPWPPGFPVDELIQIRGGIGR